MYTVIFWYIRLYSNIIHEISPFSVKCGLSLNYNAGYQFEQHYWEFYVEEKLGYFLRISQPEPRC